MAYFECKILWWVYRNIGKFPSQKMDHIFGWMESKKLWADPGEWAKNWLIHLHFMYFYRQTEAELCVMNVRVNVTSDDIYAQSSCATVTPFLVKDYCAKMCVQKGVSKILLVAYIAQILVLFPLFWKLILKLGLKSRDCGPIHHQLQKFEEG